MSRNRVQIVDDSAVVRMVLAERLERDAGIELVGSAVERAVSLDEFPGEILGLCGIRQREERT
ncbi:hypothetical protein [Zobellella iuensis]|uniref:Response regulatory domain-containing protein n=1 Tax=Zobellella iuensis TaxID=2803811 RepID=A0ABS1QLQ8_9GAMM|nr:hypothetical protein [Zobellella iuensis]MBL1375780.1 hypothetical protein [Zobellella iuensis]